MGHGSLGMPFPPCFFPVFTLLGSKIWPRCDFVQKVFSEPRARQVLLVHITEHSEPVHLITGTVLKGRPSLTGLMLSTQSASWINICRTELNWNELRLDNPKIALQQSVLGFLQFSIMKNSIELCGKLRTASSKKKKKEEEARQNPARIGLF